jgi:hypothetical protein
VICADSQESYGEYYVTVNKIQPRDTPDYDLIIGGSGNTAALIDGLSDAIERHVRGWNSSLSDEEQGRQLIEQVLLAYHAQHVGLYPAEDKDKVVHLIVCVRDKSSGDIFLWKTDGTTARSVNKYDLIGWDEPLYRHEVDRLYDQTVNESQASMIGIHLLSVGNETNNYISDPFQLIKVRKANIEVEDAANLLTLQGKVKEADEALSKFMLSAYNTSSSSSGLESALMVFEDQVLELRREAQEVFDNSTDSQRLRFAMNIQQTAEAQSKAAKLNRALYSVGFYGNVGTPGAIELRQKIAATIYNANEQLIEVIDIAAGFPKKASTHVVRELAEASLIIGRVTGDVIEAVTNAWRDQLISLEQKDRLADLLGQISKAGQQSMAILQGFVDQNLLVVSEGQGGELSALLSNEILKPYVELYSEVCDLPDGIAGEIKVTLRNARASLLLIGDL